MKLKFSAVNNTDAVDFIPIKGEHLRLFHRILFLSHFYSSSMARAVNGMDPIALDAAGYDLVVVDTPHYVRVDGIDPSRIIAVVHDLIPLRDPTMGQDWRKLFFKKTLATIAQGPNLVFVSQCTQTTFYQHFPDRARLGKEVIIYPSLRSLLKKEAEKKDVGDQAEYMQKLDSEKKLEHNKKRRTALLEEREFIGLKSSIPELIAQEILKDLGHVVKTIPGWNPDLPYFATALSDEPRKNIGLIVKAFFKLKTVANIVVIGSVDGNKYMDNQPDKYPNLHFAGYLPEADKIEIIRHSAGLIFPSFSEGFGIPIVEGAVLGVPVLCSDIPVFREIGGSFASYFDPYKPRSLELAVRSLLEDPGAAKEKAIALQSSVIKRFSQQAMAKHLSGFLEELGFQTVFRT